LDYFNKISRRAFNLIYYKKKYKLIYMLPTTSTRYGTALNEIAYTFKWLDC